MSEYVIFLGRVSCTGYDAYSWPSIRGRNRPSMTRSITARSKNSHRTQSVESRWSVKYFVPSYVLLLNEPRSLIKLGSQILRMYSVLHLPNAGCSPALACRWQMDD